MLPKEGKALDLGTGGGVIACILASKEPALNILGIDINPKAIKEANQNALINPQFQHLSFRLTSYQELLYTEKKFNTIICNPPFFDTAMPSYDIDEALAKHTLTLSPELIVETAAGLLCPEGTLNLITNLRNISEIEKLANTYGLAITRISFVRPKPDIEANRQLMEFSRNLKAAKSKGSEIIIRNLDGSYHNSYIELTRDLYLKF